jgi:hypothetical protein
MLRLLIGCLLAVLVSPIIRCWIVNYLSLSGFWCAAVQVVASFALGTNRSVREDADQETTLHAVACGGV